MGFLENIYALNRFEREKFADFFLNQTKIGHVSWRYATDLPKIDKRFVLQNDKIILQAQHGEVASTAISKAVEKISGEVQMYLRDEVCDVKPYFSGETLVQIQRGAHEFFGVKGYGVHAIAYVQKSKEIRIWVARRSKHKSKYPSLLDDSVAGGLIGGGYSAKEILVKEAWEEASIPEERTAAAVPCGIVGYKRNVGYLTEWAAIFVYDLPVDEGFTLAPNDLEVEQFELKTAQEVYKLVEEGKHYKPNCHLVQTYFLLRKGILPNTHPDYEKICESLTLKG